MNRRRWVIGVAIAAVVGVGGYLVAGALRSGTDTRETADQTGRPEGPFFFSSVEQNGGTPDGGPSILSGAPEGCVPTRTAYDWVNGGGMSVGDVLASTTSGTVTVRYTDADGYRDVSAILNGNAVEPLSHTQPFDSCIPLLVTMDIDDVDLVDLHLISPSGVDYSTATAQALGADLYIRTDFLSMEIPEPEAGDWTIELGRVGEWSRTITAKLGFHQWPPAFDPYAVCEATITGDTIEVDASKSWDEDGEVVDYFWQITDETLFHDAQATYDASGLPDGDYYLACIVTDNDGNDTFSGVYITLGTTPESRLSPETRTFSSLDFFGEPGGGRASGSEPEEGCEETRTAWETLQERDIPYGTELASSDAGVLYEAANEADRGVINMSVIFSGEGSTPIRHTEVLDSCRGLLTRMEAPLHGGGTFSLISPSGKEYTVDTESEPGVGVNSEYDDITYRISSPESGTWTLVFDPAPNAIAGAPYAILFSQDDPVFYSPSTICNASVTGKEIRVDASESWDEDGEIVRYEWTFPDGATAEGVTATHTLEGGWRGYRYVRCTLTDDDGYVTNDGVSVYLD